MDPERKLLGAAEAAPLLGIAVPTLYGLARQRKIPHIRLGDRLLFDVDEIIAAAKVPAEEESDFRNPKTLAQGGR
jgi:excisionase family DNA binding protein